MGDQRRSFANRVRKSALGRRRPGTWRWRTSDCATGTSPVRDQQDSRQVWSAPAPRPLRVSAERRWRRLLAAQSSSADLSTTLAYAWRAQIRAICQSDPCSKLGAIMIFRSYEPVLEYTPTQARRLVVAPTVRSMFGCVSGSAIAPPHQLESQSPCPLPAFVAAAAALTSASVNQ